MTQCPSRLATVSGDWCPSLYLKRCLQFSIFFLVLIYRPSANLHTYFAHALLNLYPTPRAPFAKECIRHVKRTRDCSQLERDI
ncbi:hypothetical protein L204_103911 [Cryptococcus depauperatus]